MEPRLHRHRRACSAHRRRVEAAGLLLEIDIRQLLPAVIFHDKASIQLLDRPRRREAAVAHLGNPLARR